MNKSFDTTIAKKNKIIKAAIEKAAFIIIGAGSGLSSTVGLPYDDFTTFNTWFPGYHDRYGLKTINEASSYQFPTNEEYYAFWIHLISTIRYNHPAGKPYLDLHRILHDKEYFILTTNTDGQFLKAGFPSEKLCTPQGDYTYFQCSRPCNTELYHNEKMVKEILSRMTNTDFVIHPDGIPRCPQCGSPLIPNIRRDDTFVDKPWIEKIDELNSLVEANKGKNIFLFELGAGFTFAGIIRYPFELFLLQRKNTELIRINLIGKYLSLLNNSLRAAIIQGDIGPILSKLAEEY